MKKINFVDNKKEFNIKKLNKIDIKEFTFRDAYEMLWKPKKRDTIISYRDECIRLEHHVLPYLGKMKVRKIKPLDVANMASKLRDRLSTLKRCLMRTNEILELCVVCGIIKYNRCRKTQKLFPLPIETNHPYINASDLHLLFIEAFKFKRQKFWFMPLLMFQTYSMLRAHEACSIKWSYIKGNKITIPSQIMKKKREFSLYLNNEVKHILIKMRDKTPYTSEYVFPYGRNTKYINKQYISKWLNNTPLKGKLCTHGLRATARTFLKDVKCPYEIAEDCLSHLMGTPTNRAYIRGDYYDQRIEYMNMWWEFIKIKMQQALRLLNPNALIFKDFQNLC